MGNGERGKFFTAYTLVSLEFATCKGLYVSKTDDLSQVLVVHTCNSSFLRG
jgi:hypothetical protein